jgi:plasmid replication initiation protein
MIQRERQPLRETGRSPLIQKLVSIHRPQTEQNTMAFARFVVLLSDRRIFHQTGVRG